MAAKNKAAATLARLRWQGTTEEQRSEAMRAVAVAGAKTRGKRAMRAMSAAGGRAGKGRSKPGAGRKPGPPKAAAPKRPRGRPRKTVRPTTETGENACISVQ